MWRMNMHICIKDIMCIFIYVESPLQAVAGLAGEGWRPTWAIRAAKKTNPNLDSFWPIH